MHYELCIEKLLCIEKEILGDDSGGVPPLPIPNREVKPVCADGTAIQCGRVGNRQFFTSEIIRNNGFAFLFFINNIVPL